MSAALWDVGRLLWLVTVIATIVCLPEMIMARTRRPSLASLLAHVAGTAFMIVVAVSVLSPLRLFNPFTIVLAFAGWPMALWLVRHGSRPRAEGRSLLRRAVIDSVILWESANRRQALLTAIRTGVAGFCAGLRSSGATTRVAIFVVLAATVVVTPRFVDALTNTRLVNPAAYGELVAAQQLLASERRAARPEPFAASAAALSIASSLAPVHVVRLVPPIIGFAVLIVLIAGVHRSTRMLAPALLAAVAFALMTRAAARPPGHEFADLFLLLSLLLWNETLAGGRRHRGAAVASTAVLALAAPALVAVLAVAVGALLVYPRLMLMVTGASWLGFAWLAAGSGDSPTLVDLSALSNAPLAASLLIAGVCQLCTAAFGCEYGARRTALAVAVAVVAALAMVPPTSAAHFVEYDAAARQSLEIANSLPKYRFLVVAPVEQWALTYGRGWHMNLHEFVAAVGRDAGDPGYRLPFDVDDVFVFVETRPFASFDREPQHVAFAALTDPVFRHYRSPAGRSSLQFAALDTCERLRQGHPDVRIHYDDGRLRIYRFSLR